MAPYPGWRNDPFPNAMKEKSGNVRQCAVEKLLLHCRDDLHQAFALVFADIGRGLRGKQLDSSQGSERPLRANTPSTASPQTFLLPACESVRMRHVGRITETAGRHSRAYARALRKVMSLSSGGICFIWRAPTRLACWRLQSSTFRGNELIETGDGQESEEERKLPSGRHWLLYRLQRKNLWKRTLKINTFSVFFFFEV